MVQTTESLYHEAIQAKPSMPMHNIWAAEQLEPQQKLNVNQPKCEKLIQDKWPNFQEK
jgi:hypothetical protein